MLQPIASTLYKIYTDAIYYVQNRPLKSEFNDNEDTLNAEPLLHIELLSGHDCKHV